MDDAGTWGGAFEKGGSLAAQCQPEACWLPAESPEVRGRPAPRSPVGDGPMRVPAGWPAEPPQRQVPWRTWAWASPWPRPTDLLLLLAPGRFFSARGLLCQNPRPLLAGRRVEWPGGVTALLSLQGPLLRWLKVNFSEAFIAWIHIKALRVFVESVLRCVDEMPPWAVLRWEVGRSQLWGHLGSATPFWPLQPPPTPDRKSVV